MERKLPFTPCESAGLRLMLEQHLNTVFASGAINEYGGLSNEGREADTIIQSPLGMTALPCVKSAYHIWLNMYAADRHAVLQKFQRLCSPGLAQVSGRGKTLTFCLLFIHEFAGILTAATAYPD